MMMMEDLVNEIVGIERLELFNEEDLSNLKYKILNEIKKEEYI